MRGERGRTGKMRGGGERIYWKRGYLHIWRGEGLTVGKTVICN